MNEGVQRRDLAAGRWHQLSLAEQLGNIGSESPARLREIARAREVVVDFFRGPNDYGSTAESLQRPDDRDHGEERSGRRGRGQ
jgi:hypothetical protein